MVCNAVSSISDEDAELRSGLKPLSSSTVLSPYFATTSSTPPLVPHFWELNVSFFGVKFIPFFVTMEKATYEASSLALPIFSVGLSFDRSPCFPLKYNLLPSEKLVADIAAGSDTSAAEGLSPLLSKAHLIVASLALMASSAIA